jgi:hypothetical protein
MSFQDFWSRYPKKVAKRDAEKAWSKLSMFDIAAIADAIDAHVSRWLRLRTEPQHIPHPATWLNKRRFEDEIEKPRIKVGDAGYYDSIGER